MKDRAHLSNSLITKQYFYDSRVEIMEIKDFCDRYYTDGKGTNCLKWDDLDVQFDDQDLVVGMEKGRQILNFETVFVCLFLFLTSLVPLRSEIPIPWPSSFFTLAQVTLLSGVP